MRTVVLVPRRPDGGHRDRSWAWLQERWAREHPDFEVFVGSHDDGAFNRSVAMNAAARLAGDWDRAVIADADSFCSSQQLLSALDYTTRTGQMTIAFTRFCYLTEPGSQRVMEGYTGSWEPLIASSFRGGCSSAVTVTRELWDLVGGFDEGFIGWGEEDVAFSIACQALAPGSAGAQRRGPTKGNIRGTFNRLKGDCWHLWHPRASGSNGAPDYKRTELWRQNAARREHYVAAAHDREAMLALLEELGLR